MTARLPRIGDRVRYGAFKGKRNTVYVVTYIGEHQITIKAEGDTKVVVGAWHDERVIGIDAQKPRTKRIPIYQARDVLTILREGQRA